GPPGCASSLPGRGRSRVSIASTCRGHARWRKSASSHVSSSCISTSGKICERRYLLAMSVQSKEVSEQTMTALESKEVKSYSAARRRRRILVNVLRVLFIVVIIGGWELGTRWVIDAHTIPPT